MGEPVPIRFPFGGISENVAFASEPGAVAVAPDQVLNVRPYDSFERRLRGGQRAGLSKFISTQVNGSNAVQNLNTQVEVVALAEDAGFGDKYGDPGTDPPADMLSAVFSVNGLWLLCGCAANGTADIVVYPYDAETGYGAQDTFDTGVSNIAINAMDMHPGGAFLACATNDTGGRLHVYNFDQSTGTIGSKLTNPATGPTGEANGVRFSPDGNFIAVAHDTSPFLSVYPFDADTGTIGAKLANPADLPTTNCNDVAWEPTGAALATVCQATPFVEAWAFSGGAIGAQYADPSSPPNSGSGDESFGVDFHPDGTHIAVAHNLTPFIFIYVFNLSTGFGAKLSNPSDLPTGALTDVRWDTTGDFVACCQSTNSNFQVYEFTGAIGTRLRAADTPTTGGACFCIQWNPLNTGIVIGRTSTPFLTGYQFTPATLNPSARRTRLIAVSGGDVYRSTIALSAWSLVSGSSQNLISAGIVRSAEAFQNMFFADSLADGYHYLRYSDNSLRDWATDLSAGALPAGTSDTTLGCRMIALYRGRIVLAGLLEEPQNWFMSRSGDPFDWDYSPATTDALQPVAGNNSNAGQIGDVVTALMPYQDDLLFFGGDHTLWMMRGDPAAGGRIDNISRQIGVVGPDAWTWDTGSTLYFMGQNGLYRLPAGSVSPELISAKKLDKTFEAIDLAANNVRLVYDREWQGVHIFIAPLSQPSSPTDHYWWDQRTNGFWRDQYPVTTGPTAMHLFDADDPDTRGVLLGGFDGYVRLFDESAAGDDGTAIDSFARFPLLHPSLPMGQFQMSDLQITLDGDGDGVAFDVYRGKTPEEAIESATSVYTKTLQAGRNQPVRKRIRANSIQFRLRNNTLGETWAYEQGAVLIEGVGRNRAAVT